MSWMQKLCEVYDAAERSEKVGNYAATPVLLRLYHGTQQAQIELTITEQGELVRGSAHAIADKDETETIIMGEPEALSVANAIKPKALLEKLIYLAGDYPKYYAMKFKNKESETATPSAKNLRPELYYKAYVEQLRLWCQSEHSHPYACAWLTYIQKGCLIADLLQEGLFNLNSEGKLSDQWVIKSDPQEAFIRFCIQRENGSDVCVWKDKGVSEAYGSPYPWNTSAAAPR